MVFNTCYYCSIVEYYSSTTMLESKIILDVVSSG